MNESFNHEEIKALNDEECLSRIKTELSKPKNRTDGIVLMLDEMGKALDFQSRENKDLHIFQSLADIVQQTASPVVLIGWVIFRAENLGAASSYLGTMLNKTSRSNKYALQPTLIFEVWLQTN